MTELSGLYYKDVEAILTAVFNQKSVGEQPSHLACINPPEDFIRHIAEIIEKNTIRGKVLAKYPLTIHVFSAKTSKDSQFGNISVRFDPEELKDERLEKTLFLFLQPVDPQQIKVLGGKLYGLIIPDSSTPADKFVLAMGAQGFLPKVQYQHRYPTNSDKTTATLNLFEPRPYVIRHPTPKDIEDLVELEKVCWVEHLQESKRELERRVTEYGPESLVIEQAGKVVAVNYAHRIPSIDVLKFGEWKKLAESSQNVGDIIRLITLNVEPGLGSKGLGDQLLEFLLYWRSLQNDVTKVVASTRCSEFQKYPDKSIEDYIHLTDDRGLPVDPTLNFHVHHGAHIVGPIPNYRPEDVDNKGNGVLIEYAVKEREYTKPTGHAINVIKTREDIKQVVEENIAMILGVEGMFEYSSSKPLMDIGFDSLRLLELRSLLSARFDTEIHPRFFFQYGTAEKAINYFAESVLETYKDWLYTVEWNETQIPLFPTVKAEEKGVWVIFADEDLFAEHLVSKMKTYGYTCVVIKNGPFFKSDGELDFSIRGDSQVHFDRVFQSKIFDQGIHGVIFLWGLFKNVDNEPALDVLQDMHKFSCLGLIHLIKTFSKMTFAHTPRLFVGSWGFQEEGDAMSLALGPLTALSKAVNTERPDFQLKRPQLPCL